jgi:hypothetical protein
MKKLSFVLALLAALASAPAPANESADAHPNRIERAAQKTGAALDRAAHKTWHGIRKAAAKTGEALQKAGRKTARWIDGKTS